MYFLRKAREVYKMESRKSLSPSFWESEGKSLNDLDDFGGIISGIEHPLGTLPLSLDHFTVLRCVYQ